MPTSLSSSSVRVARLPVAHALVQRQHLDDLLLDRVQRIERGHRLLEDHGDLVAAHLAQLLLVQRQQVLAVEQDLARTDGWPADRAAASAPTAPRPTCPSRTRRPAPPSRPWRCRRRCGRRRVVVRAALREGDGEIADGEEGRVAHLNVFRGSKASRVASPTKISSDSISEMTTKPEMPSQGALRLRWPCRSSSPSEARAGRQAEAEEIERGQRRDRAVEDEGQEGQRRHHGVGQEMPEHDGAVRHAERARRVDIFEIAGAQELGAHDADEADPGEQQHEAEQDEEARRQDGGDDQQQIEHRDRRPDLDEALEDQVGPAAEIALHGAGRRRR